MAGLYIHIPFCKQLCHYCDFFSCISLAKTGPVLEALLREMELRRRFLPGDSLSTLYVGGGTPSVYAPQELGRLTARARELWNCTGLEESTVEVNPDDLSPACLDGLLRAGFDRLSIGIQSFVDRDLRLMNRRHTAEGAEKAVREAQRAGFGNISIDLIYGIPGMSDREWRDNLERALSLEVQHISAYHLTVEPRTVFGRRAAQGKFTPVDEETSQRQYLTLHRTLTAAGYEHYEISNFARPGRRSRHNSAYWTGEPYLGIGPSAHSYDGRRRSWSPPFPRPLPRGAGGGHPLRRGDAHRGGTVRRTGDGLPAPGRGSGHRRTGTPVRGTQIALFRGVGPPFRGGRHTGTHGRPLPSPARGVPRVGRRDLRTVLARRRGDAYI